ncbi:MAG TPA: NUDIX domain-containing protein [Propionibacteriaceae bacterium]
MSDFDIRVNVGEAGTATFNWSGSISPDSLAQAVSAAADDALIGRALRRLEVSLPVSDVSARRAVTRAGFRLEGMRRQALALEDGTYEDVCLYARLTADQVHGPNGFSGVMNSVLPKKRLIAHVRITDGADRVLLCETRFKKDWELPGGIVEPGEPPRLGAIREVAEELGLERPMGPLLLADWMPPYLGWDDAIELIFDGGVIAEDELAGLTLQPSEILQVRLCTLAEAAALVTPLAHRRLTVAAGLAPGAMAYLEDGAPPAG